MNSLGTAPRFRATVVWLAASVGLATLLVWLASDVSTSPSRGFEDVLVQGCVVAASLCAVWAWVVTTLVVLEVLRHSAGGAAGVPAWARGLVLVACGVAVVGLGAPAGATAAASELDLDGLPMPDRATGGFLTETVRPQVRAEAARPATTGRSRGVHVVEAGESLWSISQDELGDPARWVAIHDANRRLIGSDPDVIDIGQHLELPRLRPGTEPNTDRGIRRPS